MLEDRDEDVGRVRECVAQVSQPIEACDVIDIGGVW